jgi:hypothetical protein
MQDELIQLWEQVMGSPPDPEQFAIWQGLHSVDIIRRSILRTAIKNQKVGGMMPQDYRIRYASKTMPMTLDRDAEHQENRRRLAQEMEAA